MPEYNSIQADSRKSVVHFFNELSKGGHIEMPLADMFWGDYFGSFTDNFGVSWKINFTNPK